MPSPYRTVRRFRPCQKPASDGTAPRPKSQPSRLRHRHVIAHQIARSQSIIGHTCSLVSARGSRLRARAAMALRPQLLRLLLPSPPHRNPPPPPLPSSPYVAPIGRRTAAAAVLLLAAGVSAPPPRPARAEPDGEDVDEARIVRLFQVR